MSNSFNPMDCSLPASLSIGLPKQAYWNVLPFPSSWDLLDLEIEPASPALQANSLPLSHQGSPIAIVYCKLWDIQSFNPILLMTLSVISFKIKPKILKCGTRGFRESNDSLPFQSHFSLRVLGHNIPSGWKIVLPSLKIPSHLLVLFQSLFC